MTTATIDPLETSSASAGDLGERRLLRVATLIVPVAERLVDARRPACRLDACSTLRRGSATQRSPPRGCCEVVGIDYVGLCSSAAASGPPPRGLEIDLRAGDAEALPFPDSSFDAVLSVFGSMFAPDHEQTAGETRPRHPARRDDRARKLDAGRLPRRPLPRRRAVRAAPGRRRLTDAVGNEPTISPRSLARTSTGRTRPRPSPSASRPPERSSTTSPSTTGRR